jgi:hypothetical protein
VGWVTKKAHEATDIGRWRLVSRRGIVRARRLDQDVEWTSSGGDILRGAPGDWLVVDESGGQRTVSDEFFQTHHRHLRKDVWERTATLEAREASPGERVESPEGVATAAPNDWVVRDAAGTQWIVPAEHFRIAYRPVDGEA